MTDRVMVGNTVLLFEILGFSKKYCITCRSLNKEDILKMCCLDYCSSLLWQKITWQQAPVGVFPKSASQCCPWPKQSCAYSKEKRRRRVRKNEVLPFLDFDDRQKLSSRRSDKYQVNTVKSNEFDQTFRVFKIKNAAKCKTNMTNLCVLIIDLRQFFQ